MSNVKINCNEIYTTDQGISLIEKYSEVFGKITKVEMNFNFMRLTNKNGDEIEIQGVFACGYEGGGPSGAYELFQKLGIDISKEFIYDNEKFTVRVK